MSLPKIPSFRLDGRRALVTGASSGIGAACASALAELGAHVVCAARGADKLQAVVEEINARGDSASALQLDMADLDQLAAALTAEAAFDVVVNSAGTARHTPAHSAGPRSWPPTWQAPSRPRSAAMAIPTRAMSCVGGMSGR